MTRITIKTDKENKFLVILIWIVVCIAAKFMLLVILPEKYSRDGRSIFLQSMTGYLREDMGFDNTAKIFSAINKVFRFQSFEMWSIFLSIICSLFLLVFLNKSLEKLSFSDFIFLTCSVFLMNIYTFTVSKDVIQLILILPAVYILHGAYKTNVKISVLIGSLLIIAFVLRPYFFLTAIMFFSVYRTFQNSYEQEKKKFWRNLIFIFLIGVLGLYVLKNVDAFTYNRLLQTRSDVNQFRIGNVDAQTAIVNLIDDDGTIITFMLNLVINMFRLLFPIALLQQGLLQILFLVYQVNLSRKILLIFYHQSNSSKTSMQNENVFIAVSLLIAYFIVAAVFEPDYGSAIRHEMIFFPVIYVALFEGEAHVTK